jgi:hypothetical protein
LTHHRVCGSTGLMRRQTRPAALPCNTPLNERNSGPLPTSQNRLCGSIIIHLSIASVHLSSRPTMRPSPSNIIDIDNLTTTPNPSSSSPPLPFYVRLIPSHGWASLLPAFTKASIIIGIVTSDMRRPWASLHLSNILDDFIDDENSTGNPTNSAFVL